MPKTLSHSNHWDHELCEVCAARSFSFSWEYISPNSPLPSSCCGIYRVQGIFSVHYVHLGGIGGSKLCMMILTLLVIALSPACREVAKPLHCCWIRSESDLGAILRAMRSGYCIPNATTSIAQGHKEGTPGIAYSPNTHVVRRLQVLVSIMQHMHKACQDEQAATSPNCHGRSDSGRPRLPLQAKLASTIPHTCCSLTKHTSTSASRCSSSVRRV